MQRGSDDDERRVEVWLSMADHFLDTETRHGIPETALRCVEAGLSSEQAAEVWRHEVTPAVGFNLMDVAGEWAAWDPDWLVKRITRIRARKGIVAWATSLARPPLLRGVRESVCRCVDLLLTLPSVEERERCERRLTFLARHCFDFVPDELKALPADEQEHVRALYPEPFRSLLAPALLPDEKDAADGRVRVALESAAMP